MSSDRNDLQDMIDNTRAAWAMFDMDDLKKLEGTSAHTKAIRTAHKAKESNTKERLREEIDVVRAFWAKEGMSDLNKLNPVDKRRAKEMAGIYEGVSRGNTKSPPPPAKSQQQTQVKLPTKPVINRKPLSNEAEKNLRLAEQEKRIRELEAKREKARKEKAKREKQVKDRINEKLQGRHDRKLAYRQELADKKRKQQEEVQKVIRETQWPLLDSSAPPSRNISSASSSQVLSVSSSVARQKQPIVKAAAAEPKKATITTASHIKEISVKPRTANVRVAGAKEARKQQNRLQKSRSPFANKLARKKKKSPCVIL